MPKDKIVDKYITKVTIVNNDPEFINYMSEEEDQRKVHNSLLREAKEEGALEEKIVIVKNLLSMNISIKDIEKATGLSSDKIQEISTQI